MLRVLFQMETRRAVFRDVETILKVSCAMQFGSNCMWCSAYETKVYATSQNAACDDIVFDVERLSDDLVHVEGREVLQIP